MNNHSVLIKRAALLAAAVLLATVVLAMGAGALIGRQHARTDARTRLLAATRTMTDEAEAALAGDAEALSAVAESLRAQFGRAGFDCLVLDMNRDPGLVPGAPDAQASEELLDGAFLGREVTSILRDAAGDSCAYAAVPLWADGAVAGALVTRTRLAGTLELLWQTAIALLIALVFALPLLYLLLKKLIAPIGLRLRNLRDMAGRVASGDFDAHADESAPGELGELGLSLNNLSSQLSRNMYMLIVERNSLKHMLNGLSEGIVAVDAQCRVTHRNPALERMFEPELAAAAADPRMRLVPDKTIWDDFEQVIADGNTITRNIEMHGMVLRLVISPIVDEIGANAGAVGLFSDITQMERLERTRRDYVANVSHEMRTPLTAMRALIEPLKEGMVTSEDNRMRYYEIIMREIMRLSRLIDDLMELSRLQSGSLAVQTQRMHLEDLVLDLGERYSSMAEDHGLTFSVDSDFAQCPQVVSNPDRIEQMLIILLDNAIKYTPEGGHIGLSASWDDDRVVLSVADTGIGISPEDLPYVFDRFYKVDKAHSGMGSGLGLSIARELLKWMGEEIWVKSEKGKGSTFSFTVRRAKEGEDEDAEALPEESEE